MADYQPICSLDGRVVTVTPIAGAEALDVNVLGAALIGGVFNQGIMVRNVANVWTDVGYFAGNLQVPVLQTDGVNTAAVLANHIGAIFDETQDSLAVSAGCFAYYLAGVATQEMRPLLVDLDDGAIAANQIPQLVINENYGYQGITWQRMLVDTDDDNIAAAQITSLVIPLLYGYSPNNQAWQRLHTNNTNALNVNIVGGGGAVTLRSEYVDDTVFIVNEDYVQAVGGCYTNDPVNLNDIGILRMSINRNLYTRLTDDVDDLDIVNEGNALDTGIVSYGYNTTLNTVHAMRMMLLGDATDFGFMSYGLNQVAGTAIELPITSPGAAIALPPGATSGITAYTYNTLGNTMQALEVFNPGDALGLGPMCYAFNVATMTANPIYMVDDADAGIEMGFVSYGINRVANTHHPLPIITSLFPAAGFIDDTTNALVTAAGGYNYYLAGLATQRAVPDLADLDDDVIATEQIPKLVIPLTYGYEQAPNVWRRVHVDDNGYWMVHLLGSFLDDSNWPVATHKVFPMGGIYTTDPVDLNDIGAVRMDIQRNLYSHILGTDRYGGDLLTGISNDVGSRAVHTSESKKEIWSDDYLFWFDDCETKSGAGVSICKWLTITDVGGADGWAPLAVTPGTHGVEYVEFDTPGSATFTIPPKEGNWFMKLWATTAQAATLSSAECYTKLGEITEKKISLEFWFSPGGLAFYPPAVRPTYGLIFGFYLFDRRSNQEKRYLVRYNCNTLSWEYYNNAGAWVAIAIDVRPVATEQLGVWHPSALWSWQYVKLGIDDEAGANGQIASLTYQDTTYAIGSDVFVVAGAGGRSGLIPYFGAELNCGYQEGEYYTGSIYFDQIKIYTNDLELYNTGPGGYGQHTTGVAPI